MHFELILQIILEQVIDNIIKLAVEHVFLQRLASLFDSNVVGSFDQATIRSIAGEDEATFEKRNRLMNEIRYAEDEITEIRRFERSGAGGQEPDDTAPCTSLNNVSKRTNTIRA